MTNTTVQKIGTPTELFRGRLIRVINQRMRFPDGSEKLFELAERAPGVRALVTDGRRILITKEWRSESESWDYRLPGGKVFDSLDEYLSTSESRDFDFSTALLKAVQKELHEETLINLPLSAFTPLYHSVCGATVIWDLHFFLAETSEFTANSKNIVTEEGEQTHPQWFNYDEALSLCLKGEVREDRTAATLFRYLLPKVQAFSTAHTINATE